MNITDFLLARIAEDEKLAQAATGSSTRWESMTEETGNGEGIYYTVEEVGTYDSPILDLTRTDRTGRAQAEHIARHDPARVLAECAAKRAIIESHHPHDHGGQHGDAVFCDECQWDHGDDAPRIDNQPVENFGANPCRTLVALAAVYKDHPGYQQEWAV